MRKLSLLLRSWKSQVPNPGSLVLASMLFLQKQDSSCPLDRTNHCHSMWDDLGAVHKGPGLLPAQNLLFFKSLKECFPVRLPEVLSSQWPEDSIPSPLTTHPSRAAALPQCHTTAEPPMCLLPEGSFFGVWILQHCSSGSIFLGHTSPNQDNRHNGW
jgi:hypothetical protein